MANDYYDNSDAGQRFQPGTTAEAAAVDQKFDEVATGFGGVEDDVTRALKLPTGTTTDQVITQSALNRRNLTLGFDSNGDLTLRAGLKWEGDWQPSTEYIAGDFVRAPNKNLYVCDVSHTSGSTFTTANWLLAVDIGDLEAIQTATEAARDTALQAETDAQTAETGAVTAKTAAETALDDFTDLYLGTKTADPTLDNDGDALQSGAIYYNSSSGALRLYTGSAWIEAAFDPSGALLSANNLSDVGSAATSRTNLGLGSSAVQDLATDAQLHAGTASKVVGADTVYSASAPVTLTDGATITPDFNAGRNFIVTLGGNRTLANPTNQTAGQTGIIIVKQDATGSRTLSFGTAWDFPGGAPSLTTTANAVDVIAYYVETGGTLLCTFSGDFS